MLLQALEEGGGGVLESISDNLVDQVWGPLRPSMPSGDLLFLELKYAGKFWLSVYIQSLCNLGKPWQDKVEDVRKKMVGNGVAVLVVTALDEVACNYLIFLWCVSDA